MIESGLLAFILIMIYMGYIMCYQIVEYKSDLIKICYHALFIGGFYGLAIVQVLLRTL